MSEYKTIEERTQQRAIAATQKNIAIYHQQLANNNTLILELERYIRLEEGNGGTKELVQQMKEQVSVRKQWIIQINDILEQEYTALENQFNK